MEDRLGVLIIEDDLIQAKALEKMVMSLDHLVIGTSMSGECAVKLTAEVNPDIIFLDIALKKNINGIEAAHMINNISDASIIYLTGNSWAKDDKRLKASKFVDILIKPITKEDIQKAILKCVSE